MHPAARPLEEVLTGTTTFSKEIMNVLHQSINEQDLFVGRNTGWFVGIYRLDSNCKCLEEFDNKWQDRHDGY